MLLVLAPPPSGTARAAAPRTDSPPSLNRSLRLRLIHTLRGLAAPNPTAPSDYDVGLTTSTGRDLVSGTTAQSGPGASTGRQQVRHQVSRTRPSTRSNRTGPYSRESMDGERLSPITKIVPVGTVTGPK